MTRLPEEWRDDELVGFFMRHVVPLYINFEKDGKQYPIVYTAFVFSVYDRWLLMTAGHCITEIKELREEKGFKIVDSALLDGLNTTARHIHAVPFNYDDALPVMLGLHHTWDYGVMYVNTNLRSLLETNGVKAFTELSWEPVVSDVEHYRVLGLPGILTSHYGDNRVQLTPIFPTVNKLEERPEGFEETNAPMFYGRLPTKPLSTLRGMSGGPVLAFATVGGRLRYWLHAMIVSTVNENISAMMMRPLGKYLQEVIDGKHDEPDAKFT